MSTTMTAERMYRLNADHLMELAHKHREEYANAKPFPYIVFDNFLLDTSILDAILEEFPKPNDIEWQRFKNGAERKLASSREQFMGDATRTLMYQLNSSTFISFLEVLTGIDGIIPDPHFEGGGLHQIEPGGYLKMHVDFNKNSKLNLDRRLNVLIYLNKNWEESYNGHFELWDAEMKGCEKKVLPLFNRCVIFTTSDFSYHGHPDPLTCPEGMTRKSLALYYYTNGRPAHELSGKDHTTIFQERPQDKFQLEEPSGGMKDVLKKFVPPIVFEMRDALKK